MLEGKCVVFTNLKVKKLGGVPSHGMVMCAYARHSEEVGIEMVRAPEEAEIGERVQLRGGDELS